MSFNSFPPVGENQTPQPIKWLLVVFLSLSLGFSLLSILLKDTIFFNPSYIFGLSLHGIQRGFVFQFITYPFFQLPSFRFDFSYLIHLFFSLYILWLTSTQITQRVGMKKFLFFLATCILATGGFSLFLMSFNPMLYILSGTTPLIYAFLIAWLMLYPDTKILLFFVFPLQIKHLVVGILGVNLFLDITNGDFILFGTYIFSAILAYFFSLIFFHCNSPFAFLSEFEKKFFHLRARSRIKKESTYHASKIYDFKTGDPILDDEQFMDAMLTKISLYGEEALTTKERIKMKKISKKKKS